MNKDFPSPHGNYETGMTAGHGTSVYVPRKVTDMTMAELHLMMGRALDEYHARTSLVELIRKEVRETLTASLNEHTQKIIAKMAANGMVSPAGPIYPRTHELASGTYEAGWFAPSSPLAQTPPPEVPAAADSDTPPEDPPT